MGYETVLKKAGYDVIAFESFGSYCGEWAAILKTGEVILGPFGSCSVCDQLESYLRYSRKPEDMTEDECKKFCEDAGYQVSKDYKGILIKDKWDSNSSQRSMWISNKLIELGFMVNGPFLDESFCI